jgi:hypothetical protein
MGPCTSINEILIYLNASWYVMVLFTAGSIYECQLTRASCFRFCPRSLLPLDPELIDQIPGRQNDRKTPLGELNWIFTAITDTIAWNVLPRG